MYKHLNESEDRKKNLVLQYIFGGLLESLKMVQIFS